MDSRLCQAISARLESDRDFQRANSWKLNDSAFLLGDRLRYVERRLDPAGIPVVSVAAVEVTRALAAVLECASKASPFLEILHWVRRDCPDLAVEDIGEFLHDLIDMQILQCSRGIQVTGDISAEVELTRMARSSPEIRAALEGFTSTEAVLDSRGLGQPIGLYEQAKSELSAAVPGCDADQVFQVDLLKPAAAASLGSEVVDTILDGVQLLCRFSQETPDPDLTQFARDFTERYGDAYIPLLEALDDDVGVGFLRQHQRCNESLLDGIDLREVRTAARSGIEELFSVQLRLAQRAWRDGATVVELEEEDVAALPSASIQMPDTFSVLCSVLGPSTEAVRRGEYHVWIRGADGPVGARLLGRFCDLDESLVAAVRDYTGFEQQSFPDAVLAEIAHLPDGHAGNIVFRPCLREYELTYLGRSGAPPEHQLAVRDLVVRVVGGRIQLWSDRLCAQIIPRLSTAHNYRNPNSLPVYAFLGRLQQQGVVSGFSWDWGRLGRAEFLPRVQSKRVILTPARWRVGRRQLMALSQLNERTRARAVREWRQERGIPEEVLVGDDDGGFWIDLKEPTHVDALLEYGGRRDSILLAEALQNTRNVWVEGPEGRFCNEFIIPFRRRRKDQKVRSTVNLGRRAAVDRCHLEEVATSYPPGSSWLYLKVYVGPVEADRLLVDEIAPLVRDFLRAGVCHQWFFVRYRDPDWHIRLRLSGEAEGLLTGALPAFNEALRPLIVARRVRNLQVDSYRPEVFRYGGPEAIGLAERLFCADSDASLALLPSLLGQRNANLRWQVALAGVDRLLTDLGYSREDKIRISRTLRDSLQSEFRLSAEAKRQIALRHRQFRDSVDGWLAGRTESDLQRVVAGVFGNRTLATEADSRRLQALNTDGRLWCSMDAIVKSIVHMHLNRMLRSQHRRQEAIIYHILHEVYRSLDAREKRGLAELDAHG